MGNEKKEDLTTKNLVDKLLETFGETDSKGESAKQMSIEGLQEEKKDGLAPGLEESLRSAEQFMDHMLREEELKKQQKSGQNGASFSQNEEKEEETLPSKKREKPSLFEEEPPEKPPVKKKEKREEEINLEEFFGEKVPEKSVEKKKTEKKAKGEKSSPKGKKEPMPEEKDGFQSDNMSNSKETNHFAETEKTKKQEINDLSDKTEEKDRLDVLFEMSPLSKVAGKKDDEPENAEQEPFSKDEEKKDEPFKVNIKEQDEKEKNPTKKEEEPSDPFENEDEDFFAFEDFDEEKRIKITNDPFETEEDLQEMPLGFDEEDSFEEDLSESVKAEEENGEEAPSTEEEPKESRSEEEEIETIFGNNDLPTAKIEEEKEQDVPLEKDIEEQSQSEKELDENEMRLKMIFDKGSDLKKEIGEERYKRLLKDIDGEAKAEEIKEEYESSSQNADFFKKYRKAYHLISLRAVIAALALVLVALLETGFFKIPTTGVLGEITNNPVLKALSAMQITLLLGAIGYKEVGKGFKALGTGRALPEVFLALTTLFSVVYEGAMVFCHSVYATFYNLPVALMVFISVLFTRANLKRNIYSFKVVSSRKPKFAVTHRNEKESTLEKETFGEYIPTSSGIFGVGKAPFIRGFCGRSAKEPHYKVTVGILAAASVVAALIFFVLGYYFSPKNANSNLKLLSAFNMSILAFLLTVPFSAFISYSLPFYKASKKAFSMDSAIIGEFSLEEYAEATVITFDDKAVFPPQNVRVRSLKLYGDSRIDHVLFGAASVFHRLGGPLEDVFAVATKESGYSEDVDILEIEEGGVEAAVKGAKVYVGSAEFMKERGFLASVDPNDASMEFSGKVSIMYFAIGKELAAKMYIEYKPDKEFESIMEALYKSGMCIGIRTLDPNIDDRMMRHHVGLSKYPVRVLRTDRRKDDEVVEEIDSGVISKKSVKHLLKTLSFCKRVLQVLKASTVIKGICMLLGVALSGFILFLITGGQLAGAFAVNPLWVTIYQLCMMLPILLISLIFA